MKFWSYKVHLLPVTYFFIFIFKEKEDKWAKIENARLEKDKKTDTKHG